MSLAATFSDERIPAQAKAVSPTCAHCGQPVAGAAERFCCTGCAGAYRFIEELGLQSYYARRLLDPNLRLPTPPQEETAAAAFAAKGPEGTASLNLTIDGLHCPACVWLIETALARQPDVIEARVNLTGRSLRLVWRGESSAADRLIGVIERLGYRAVPFDAGRSLAAGDAQENQLLRAMAVAGFAAANVMLLSASIWAGLTSEMGEATRDFLHWVSAGIAMPAVAFAGRPFFRSAWAALSHGRTNMDVPISLGVILATGMSLFETIASGRHAYFDSAVSLLFFLLLGRYLDLRARGKARSAAEQLLRLMARPATLIDGDGRTRGVAVRDIAVGDRVLVAPGERVPVDGRVWEGSSSIDKSLVDGESAPVPVTPGSPLLAGVLNIAAPLTVRVTATGDRTFLAEMHRLLEAAEQGRAKLVVLADRVARRYAPVVHLLALGTFLAWLALAPWQEALMNAVAVLIITCPCALGLAVPVVQIVAGGRLLRRGILLKSGTALERLATVDTVVFDKTGTLTMGQLFLIEKDIDPDTLREAAGLAAVSRHPLSRALQRACPDAPAAREAVEKVGAGLSLASPAGEIRLGSRAYCRIEEAPQDDRPELWFTRPDRNPQRFTFADRLRPEAGEVIRSLQAAGKRVVLISGDREPVVAATGKALGIADCRWGITPAGKVAALRDLAAEGRHVLMVGDGLNDAPALAAAHVSLSPALAADVSQTAADAVFQGQSLSAVSILLDVAQKADHLVRQNIGFSLAYNFLAVPLAMLGLATPLIAALAMSTSSIVVVLNALRLAEVRK